jgi:hypothetical protein
VPCEARENPSVTHHATEFILDFCCWALGFDEEGRAAKNRGDVGAYGWCGRCDTTVSAAVSSIDDFMVVTPSIKVRIWDGGWGNFSLPAVEEVGEGGGGGGTGSVWWCSGSVASTVGGRQARLKWWNC